VLWIIKFSEKKQVLAYQQTKLVVIFLIEEEGNCALAHHLPKVHAKQSFFSSASALDCRLVVADFTSRTDMPFHQRR
jgi:hypothetical protein